jgi:metal-sulfur cluster biosynthetic enzyme
VDLRTEIVDALRDVYDPCCEDRGLSVVDMGLIEDIRVADGRASVDLVLTSGWCPFMVPLVETIRERVAALRTVADADIRVVWDTAWTSGRLSPLARERLQFLPPPNQITGAGPAAPAVPASATTTPR